jgi:cytochrome d ubiquinol oxidase subunit I
VLSVFCVECGWIVTEVGRQPWIVYGYMRTADAVTNAGFVRLLAIVVVIVYTLIGIAALLTLRAMSRRWTAGDSLQPVVPYGPMSVAGDLEVAARSTPAGSPEPASSTENV